MSEQACERNAVASGISGFGGVTCTEIKFDTGIVFILGIFYPGLGFPLVCFNAQFQVNQLIAGLLEGIQAVEVVISDVLYIRT